MTDRLDRIEQAIERTSANVEDLLGAISMTDRQVRDLRGESGDAKQRFEVLRAEAKNDRDETRQLWNDAVTQMEIDRAESRDKFDRAIAQMDADRTKADERHAAHMEVIQTLLIELTKSNGNINTLRDRIDLLEQPREAS